MLRKGGDREENCYCSTVWRGGGWLTAFAGGGRRGFYRDIFNLLLPLAVSKMSFFLNILLYCCLF
jgi:hypothetical protein